MRSCEHRGVTLSAIGIGCYGLAGAYGRPRPRGFTGVIRRAMELGITYFDTAASYGDAERILGRAVAGRRDAVFLATKIGVGAGGKADLSRGAVRRSCTESLRRLGTDRIDLLQVHFDDPRRSPEEIVDALEELVRDGMIRFYGIAHLSADRAAALVEAGRPFSIQMELSAVARQSESTLLPLCRRRHLAGVAFSVTGRGLLTGRVPGRRGFPEEDIRRIDPLFQRERLASGLRIAAELARMGRERGCSAAQIAIAWVLSRPGIQVALTGPSRLAHLEENARAGDLSLSADAVQAVDRLLHREEETLRVAQAHAVRAILTAPLPSDPEAAFTDLVYAMEASIDQDLAREEDLLPLFRDLYALRGLRDPSLAPRFERVRRQLCGLSGLAIPS